MLIKINIIYMYIICANNTAFFPEERTYMRKCNTVPYCCHFISAPCGNFSWQAVFSCEGGKKRLGAMSLNDWLPRYGKPS